MLLLVLATAALARAEAAAGAAGAAADGAAACGGRLRAAHGTLSTPRFPHAFPLPLRCRWVIEPERAGAGIAVFLTQQYVTAGLTFTEYVYYDDTYKLGERRVFAVTEENITRVKYIQVSGPVLVVELAVSALEGTQLRALGLLGVFGMNITYAVTPAAPPAAPPPGVPGGSVAAAPAPPPPPPSCSALECRLLGHCYATHDYQSFFCACFPGYSGADCGAGPLCRGSRCRNGGTCKQMGLAAVSCLCPPQYTGELCETPLAPPDCGIEECRGSCYDESCNCHPKDSDNTSARFDTGLQLTAQSNANISSELTEQITSALEDVNVTLQGDIEILNMSAADGAGARTAWVRLWGARRDAGALRQALAQLPSAPRAPRPVRLLPAAIHLDMQPALSLQNLIVNQRSEVWEGSEFIISCTAIGSANTIFTWYKEGVEVNFNGTSRDIWSRTVAEDGLGRRTAVLGADGARPADAGRWACAAADAGRRRCRALWLTVLRPPEIELAPTALTVMKGDNASITCLIGAGPPGALGFSWAREGQLIPLTPGREVWEDLYPSGSVLKLYNIQKTSEYRCQVSSTAGTNAKSVTIWALGAGEAGCEAAESRGVRWPRTAPGAHAAAPCPPGHAGEARRHCDSKTNQHGVKWQSPDFSGCIADDLKSIYDEFAMVSFGYSRKDVSKLAEDYSKVMGTLPPYPGDGVLPLRHANEMLRYLLKFVTRPKDKRKIAGNLLKIYDILLGNRDSFLDQEDIFRLQKALMEAAAVNSHLELHGREFDIVTEEITSDNPVDIKIEPKINNEKWQLETIKVEIIGGTATVIAVQYNNLENKLPSLKTSIEYKDGKKMEYNLTSQQIQISTANTEDRHLQCSITLTFTLGLNHTFSPSVLVCGLRTSIEQQTWSAKECDIWISESKQVTCKCHSLGTYALFTVARSSLSEAGGSARRAVRSALGAGGALCLAAAALQLPGLLRRARLPPLLKATAAGSHSAAMLTILDCDARQEAGCAGALGWACAACWCAGGAALCAQPLLLQAELAGRRQRAPSVGLLAGVSTLVWLTSRLAGGAPLQLGAPAQAVAAAGCALLAALCLALCVLAALRLRVVARKLPSERQHFLRSKRRTVRHSLALLATTGAAQAAALLYVQPGEPGVLRAGAAAAAAVANGVAMVVCYVVLDGECVRGVRAALAALAARDWRAAAGDTSLNLYIKQACEVESKGGADSSPPRSPAAAAAYWRAPPPESPLRRHVADDSRADIVRCVEYSACARAPCDLVSHARPCRAYLQTHADVNCALCDAGAGAALPSPPPRGCLKRPSPCPVGESLQPVDECKPDIEQVNREWNRAYGGQPSAEGARGAEGGRVLTEISQDLDFLLNRAPHEAEVIVLEAPDDTAS